jgi:hypothetical protein
VRAGDVVVLHDPIAAAPADAVRARGAHAIWRLPVERLADAVDEAWALAHRSRPRVVCEDHDECVGGRLHPRPVVAPR